MTKLKRIMLGTFLVLLSHISGIELTETELDQAEELMPLPEALKLIYPEFTLELDDIPLQLEDLADLPLVGEDLKAQKRNYYLKKILRQKRQRPDFLKELDNSNKFYKARLPVTELKRIQRENTNVRLVKIVRNKKLDEEHAATFPEFEAPEFDSIHPHTNIPKAIPSDLEEPERAIVEPLPIVPVPSRTLEPPVFVEEPIGKAPIVEEAENEPQDRGRIPRMFHVMDIQRDFNALVTDKFDLRPEEDPTWPEIDTTTLKPTTLEPLAEAMDNELRALIRDEVQRVLCEMFLGSPLAMCLQGYVPLRSYQRFQPSPYPSYTPHAYHNPYEYPSYDDQHPYQTAFHAQ